MKYEALISGIVDCIGGLDNLRFANHCATRLRLKLKDLSKLDEGSLKAVDGVLGVRNIGDGEVQVIVGTNVIDIFKEFMETTHFSGETDDGVSDAEAVARADTQPAGDAKSRARTVGRSIMDYLGGTVAPIIPIYMSCGMVMAFLTICTTFLGLDPQSGTVTILNGMANAGFYFIPIALGWSAASKMGVEPALGALLGATLLYSTINGVAGLDFLGIPVYAVSYNGTFLPIVLGVPFMAMIYKFFKDKIPHGVHYFLLPLVTMLISVPVTLIVLGPAGYVAGTGFSVLFTWLSENAKLLASGLWSAFCPIGIITGMDKAVYAINMNHMLSVGYDNMFCPGGLAGNSAIGGAALAVWFMSKNSKTKQLGASSGITAILGITEPALYGICLEFGRPLVGAMAGAAVGGMFGALFDLKQYSWAGPGLMTSATYISPTGDMTNFYFCLATIAVSAVAGFAITMLLSSKDKKQYD
jgi:PTS system beta-glucosides-specific IIC component